MQKKITSPIIGLILCACVGVGILQTGCTTAGKVTISPALVQQGVATGVSYSTAKYPEAVPYLRAAAPIICSAANGTNLSPSQVIAAIESSGATALKTPTAVLILNASLTLYIGVWQSYGESSLSNAPALRPYLQATCNGLNEGLPSASGVLRASRPGAEWPHVKFE